MGMVTPMDVGVLGSQHLRWAISEGIIRSYASSGIGETAIQPASLDLTLSGTAHRLRCSFLPDNLTVSQKLDMYSMGSLDLSQGAILERNRPYLVELNEHLELPAFLRARANPRSTTGRLDVFTRLITDHSFTFDDVRPGYSGPMYLEIVPRTFTIKVQEGDSLNQIRLMAGRAELSDEEVLEVHKRTPLAFRDGRAVDPEEIAIASGLFLGVDIGQGSLGKSVGYRARENSALLDVSARGKYERRRFWDEVLPDGPGFIILNPENFYLLMSQDSVCVPPQFAAEMTAYDPTSGELRTHYAGFFDPGFGFFGDGSLGTRAALEVRAHDVPFAVEQGQLLCRLTFERMIAPPDVLYGAGVRSNYSQQQFAVGKQFRND